ncbi:thioredoxin [Myxacorys almedinensis]|uniref:Thioredoxin n=1 Tax=Myxacorys almedinensis A TaxID=2690445 RepID=A0A8J7Z813_9CYAN|nr:thioredoxin [Myxacorys almedinensis]NDJ18073.1 thioredoxin [Myxacorys almedinensis A]
MATKQQFNSFQELIASSDLPILVDFYAPWCGPCQMMAGFLDQANEQLKDQIKVVKINVDNYPELASQYQVFALPTLVLFKQGQPAHRIEGVIRPQQLVERIQSLM